MTKIRVCHMKRMPMLFAGVMGLMFFLACTPQKKHNIIMSNDMLCGEWTLMDGEEQVVYPEIEFSKDSSAVLYSQADTLYRFTYFVKNDSLHLIDVNGKEYVNQIRELSDQKVVFEGIADMDKEQTYKK